MNFRKKIISAIIMLIFTASAYAGEIVRPEYPRPQFVRQTWVNLNGDWSFSLDLVKSGKEKGYADGRMFDQRIVVPFCPESKLSGVEHTDFIPAMWYQRTILVPKTWGGNKIMLNFGAVYYMAEIFVDGKFAGRHFGGSSSFSVDITRFVKPGSEHNLTVYVENNLRDVRQSAGKQSLQYASAGCAYTRTTGIWQTVWMEALPENGLSSVHVVTDIDRGSVLVKPTFHKGSDAVLRIFMKDGDKVVAKETIPATNGSFAVLMPKNCRLWSLEDPFLYGLTYELVNGQGQVTDRVESYVGMRKIHTEGNKVYLNNHPCYQRLVLDQGFYPDGIWTAPTDADLKRDIELSKQAGFNGARLHQKIFEERFHYWADKLGYLTWGEAASWGMDGNDPVAARNFLTEWAEIVVRDRNHPSLVIWTPLNEAWSPDQLEYPRFMSDLYDLTKSLDPTRPFHDCSGGVHVKTDIYSTHTYEQDPAKLKTLIWNDGKLLGTPNNQAVKQFNAGFNTPHEPYTYDFPLYDGSVPYMLDEFGGIRWVGEQHVDNTEASWGYGRPPLTLTELYDRLSGQVDALLSLSDNVCGYCYTQLTDVEQEQNGIFRYDRTPKFDMERIHAIFSRIPSGK